MTNCRYGVPAPRQRAMFQKSGRRSLAATSLAPETSARRPQECGRGRHECLRHV